VPKKTIVFLIRLNTIRMGGKLTLLDTTMAKHTIVNLSQHLKDGAKRNATNIG
jgi:hypothetical protein